MLKSVTNRVGSAVAVCAVFWPWLSVHPSYKGRIFHPNTGLNNALFEKQSFATHNLEKIDQQRMNYLLREE